MTPNLPPNQGDGMPRHRHEQLSEIARMYGEAAPIPAPVACVSPGATVVFELHWSGLRSRAQLRKLSDEEYAEYERSRTAALPYVGEHVRHFNRPLDQWTADDLDRLAADMLATLRACPPPRKERFDRRTYIGVNRFNGANATHDKFGFVIMNDSEYRASVELRPCQIPLQTIVAWLARLDPYALSARLEKRGVVLTVQENKSVLWEPGAPDPDPNGGCSPFGRSGRVREPSHPDAQPQEEAGEDVNDEDDDDLDAFEKVARRTLHGEKAIPNTSRDTTPRQTRSAPRRHDADTQARAVLFRAAMLLSGKMLRALAGLAQSSLDALDGAR